MFMIRYLFLFASVWMFLAEPAMAKIGEIVETDGKVQIRTAKAKKLIAEPGLVIGVMDMVKVRKQSIAHFKMIDNSKFQIASSTTVVFDEFVFDEKKQRLTARILDGVLAFDGKKLKTDSQRKFVSGGYTLTVRGTKFAGSFGRTNKVFLLQGSINVSGGGNSVDLIGPMTSIKFDQKGIGAVEKVTIDEVKNWFMDVGLDFKRLVGAGFEENLKGGSLAVD